VLGDCGIGWPRQDDEGPKSPSHNPLGYVTSEFACFHMGLLRLAWYGGLVVRNDGADGEADREPFCGAL
jgi:hypothetical protein